MSTRKTKQLHYHVGFHHGESLLSEIDYGPDGALKSVNDFLGLLAQVFPEDSKQYSFEVEQKLYEQIEKGNAIGIFGGTDAGMKVVWQACDGCHKAYSN